MAETLDDEFMKPVAVPPKRPPTSEQAAHAVGVVMSIAAEAKERHAIDASGPWGKRRPRVAQRGQCVAAGREKKSIFAWLSTTQVVETWLGENDFSRFFLTTAEADQSPSPLEVARPRYQPVGEQPPRQTSHGARSQWKSGVEAGALLGRPVLPNEVARKQVTRK